MPPSAHIAGIPVEETLASFGPALVLIAGVWILTAKSKLSALRRRLRPVRRMKVPHGR